MVKITPELVLSASIVLLGMAEAGLGGWVCAYLTNLRIGGWWGALAVMVSGGIAFGAAFQDRSVGFTGRMITLLSLILILACTLMDGIEAGVFLSFDGCLTASYTNLNFVIPNGYWGSSTVESNAFKNCLSTAPSAFGSPPDNCVCYNQAANTCYGPYTIHGQTTSCGTLVQGALYSVNLKASAILCAILTVLVAVQAFLQWELYDRLCGGRRTTNSSLSKPLASA